MRISRIDLQRYRVPFRRPFSSGHGTEYDRRGVLVRLTTAGGVTGLGEAAPLPSFGTGTLEETERRMCDLTERLTGERLSDVPAILDSVAGDSTAAPARFALDTAALDAEARIAGVSLARHLHQGAVRSVPLNVTIGDLDASRAAETARDAIDAGYPAIKLKVGTQRDLSAEVQRVRMVREAVGPQTELRLDANGAWNLEQAIEIGDALDGLDIDYLEQPLPGPDIEGMARLREAIDVPIAADEAATTAEAVRRIIELGAADVLIVKPGVVGGLRVGREIIDDAQQAGIGVIVTTALETGVGIAAALHLAATLAEPVPACGLATGALLENDLLVQSPAIQDGRMIIPTGPGLGVDIEPGVWE